MRVLAAVLGLLVVLMSVPVLAGEAQIAAIKAVLAPGPVDAGLFNTDFRKVVPPDKLEAAVEQIKTQIGPVVAVEARGGQTYAVETAAFEMVTDIALDGSGKIAGLLFHAPIAKTASLEDLLHEM